MNLRGRYLGTLTAEERALIGDIALRLEASGTPVERSFWEACALLGVRLIGT